MAVQPDLEIQLLRYLPQRYDDDEVHEWIGLNDLLLAFARTGSDEKMVSAEEAEDISDTLSSLADRGLLEKRSLNNKYPTSNEYRLTWSGEGLLDPSSNSDDLSLPFEREVLSRDWTGLEFSSVSVDRLIAQLNGALSDLDNLDVSQIKKAQARSLLIAAKVLVEAPEPPAETIRNLILDADRLINVSGWLFGIGSFIVSILN